ncbi:MAG: hypothetical protein AAB635_00895 [Patescibacteria group bacterium]
MFKKTILASLLVFALPAVALAAEGYMFDVEMFPAVVEQVLEIVNLLIALLAGIYAIKLAALSQGGSMEKTWNTLAVVAILFVLIEVIGALKEFGVVHIGGLGEIAELAFALTFAYCLFFTKKDLLKKTLGQ